MNVNGGRDCHYNDRESQWQTRPCLGRKLQSPSLALGKRSGRTFWVPWDILPGAAPHPPQDPSQPAEKGFAAVGVGAFDLRDFGGRARRDESPWRCLGRRAWTRSGCSQDDGRVERLRSGPAASAGSAGTPASAAEPQDWTDWPMGPAYLFLRGSVQNDWRDVHSRFEKWACRMGQAYQAPGKCPGLFRERRQVGRHAPGSPPEMPAADLSGFPVCCGNGRSRLHPLQNIQITFSSLYLHQYGIQIATAEPHELTAQYIQRRHFSPRAVWYPSRRADWDTAPACRPGANRPA